MRIKTPPPPGFTVVTVQWHAPRRYLLLRATGAGEWHEVRQFTSWEAASNYAWKLLGQERVDELGKETHAQAQ